MKHLVIILAAFLAGKLTQAQQLTNDTVVCIIDTTKSYVQYWDNPIQRENYQFPPHWKIVIDGHYYDDTPDEESAFWVFQAGLWGGVKGVEGFPKKTVLKKGLEERFILKDDEWINQQTSLQILKDTIGSTPFDRYNYIIFSQDYYCTESDSVMMHRVQIGLFGEVHY